MAKRTSAGQRASVVTDRRNDEELKQAIRLSLREKEKSDKERVQEDEDLRMALEMSFPEQYHLAILQLSIPSN